MVHHHKLRHPALVALRAAADQLAHRERWLEPTEAWIPDAATAVLVLT